MTDLATEIEALRQDLADIRASLPRRRHGKPENKQSVNVRLERHELAAVDAAAEQKGLSRSQFMRDALASVVGFVTTPRQEIPAPFRNARNRRKTSHFHDPKSPAERNPREMAKHAVNLGLQRQAILRELRDDAPAPVIQGMLSEAARLSVPKPSR